MKRWLTLSNIHFFLFLAVVALIPFAMNLISYTLALWFITGIVLYILQRKKVERPSLPLSAVFLGLFYLLVLAGIMISSDVKGALFDAQVKLSLFLMPVPVLLLGALYRQKRQHALLVFTLANVIAVLVCIAVALFRSIHVGQGGLIFDPIVPGIYQDVNTAPSTWFSYTDFSIFKHPAYFSMYLIFSLFILVHFFSTRYQAIRNIKVWYILLILMALVLLAGVYFLRSKAGYISLFLLLCLTVLHFMIRKRRVLIPLALTALIMGLAAFWIMNNSRFYYVRTAFENRSEFFRTIQEKDYRAMIDEYGIDRIPLWMTALEAGHEHALTGTGSGDVHQVLNEKFRQYNLFELEAAHYNCHNQFLETYLAGGIWGLLLLLSWLISPLIRKKVRKPYSRLVPVFIGLLIINYLFESMLNSFAGVIFTACFYTLLVIAGPDRESDHVNRLKEC